MICRAVVKICFNQEELSNLASDTKWSAIWPPFLLSSHNASPQQIVGGSVA